jgi:hypothetical protein
MYCKRHDEARTHGWQVQVPGHPSEFFADSKHGGRVAAFRKARQRAAELADGSRVNLKTGRFLRNPDAADGGVFRIMVQGRAFWVAAWSPEPGTKKQARFSVGKWGEKGAERKAREERAARVAELLGPPLRSHVKGPLKGLR